MEQIANGDWSLARVRGWPGYWSLRMSRNRAGSGDWRERSTWIIEASGAHAAEAKARKLVAERGGRGRSRRNHTVEGLVDEFLAFSLVRGRSPRTIRDYEQICRRFFLPSIGHIPVRDLTPFDLDTLYTLALQQKSPLTASSIRKYHAVISAALGQAVKWGWIQSNPARSVSVPPIARRDKALPTPEEVAKLIHECTRRDPRLGAFVLLAAITGCRRGELAALRWTDVEDDLIRVRHSVFTIDGAMQLKSTKSGRERVVSVGPQLRSLLSQWKREDEKVAKKVGVFDEQSFLFSDDPLGITPLNINAVSASFRKAADSLDPPLHHVTLHDLRHFAATQLLIAGANVRDVADRLGHANAFFTLNQYVHSTTDRQQLAGVLAESIVITG